MHKLRILALMTLLLPLLVGPALAVSDEQLDAVSRQEAAQLEAQYGLVTEPSVIWRVQQVLNRLLPNAKQTRWSYQVKVLNADVPNAFAFPNGWVYVNKGLLSMPATDDELAFVLAHEVAHVTQDHARRRIDQAMLTGTIIGILTGQSESWVQILGDILNATMQSGYSREQEIDADRIGLETVYKSGFNTRGAITFFQKLQAAEGGGEGIRIFPSHPRTADRVRNMEELIARYPAPSGTQAAASPETIPPPGAAPAPGLVAQPPDFSLKDRNGQTWRMLDHVGQGTVVVYFWDASAGLTAQELPNMDQLQQGLGSKVTVVAIHTNAQFHPLARDWVEKMNLQIPVLFDDGNAFLKYGVVGVAPQIVMIDAQGRLRYRAIGMPNADLLLRTLSRVDTDTGLLAWARGGPKVVGALAKRHRAQLAIQSAPKGAKMSVNGAPRGKAPRTIELPAGKYLVELTLPRSRPTKFIVDLGTGTRTELFVPVQ
ncbi:MAG: M48 family metalloprotease [Armatimonadetes bacterium]|nr:M48 family metalloprotease [Armatimonadota bacterium]